MGAFRRQSSPLPDLADNEFFVAVQITPVALTPLLTATRRAWCWWEAWFHRQQPPGGGADACPAGNSGHLENLLQRLLVVEPEHRDAMDAH